MCGRQMAVGRSTIPPQACTDAGGLGARVSERGPGLYVRGMTEENNVWSAYEITSCRRAPLDGSRRRRQRRQGRGRQRAHGAAPRGWFTDYECRLNPAVYHVETWRFDRRAGIDGSRTRTLCGRTPGAGRCKAARRLTPCSDLALRWLQVAGRARAERRGWLCRPAHPPPTRCRRR